MGEFAHSCSSENHCSGQENYSGQGTSQVPRPALSIRMSFNSPLMAEGNLPHWHQVPFSSAAHSGSEPGLHKDTGGSTGNIEIHSVRALRAGITWHSSCRGICRNTGTESPGQLKRSPSGNSKS